MCRRICSYTEYFDLYTAFQGNNAFDIDRRPWCFQMTLCIQQRYGEEKNIHFEITRTPLKCKRWYKFTISKTDKPFKCILPLAAPKIVILKTFGTANGKYFRDVKKIVNGIGMFPGFHHSIKFSIGVLRKECGPS